VLDFGAPSPRGPVAGTNWLSGCRSGGPGREAIHGPSRDVSAIACPAQGVGDDGSRCARLVAGQGTRYYHSASRSKSRRHRSQLAENARSECRCVPAIVVHRLWSGGAVRCSSNVRNPHEGPCGSGTKIIHRDLFDIYMKSGLFSRPV